MEARNDDLQSVSVMADSLSDALQQSRLKTAHIEDLIKSIAHTADIDISAPLSQPLSQSGSESETGEDQMRQHDEQEQLERLKSENLQLLIDIQRQEYLSKQWNATIQQNQRLLDTIDSWAKTHPKKRIVDYKELQKKAAKAMEDLEQSTLLLMRDVKESETDIRELALIVSELQTLIDNDLNQVQDMKTNRAQAAEKVIQLQKEYVKYLSK